eukprot:TRINITY_DN1739_c0_g1_i1.p1 TRINITY_DN1739_c0_g1~~TRINITY_DN1739_c0_g1_i1.p1  ORF type:complete len:1267 (+),score=177.96 TRINITY_DN1739_c0_g1_i1:80-3880(+)
MEALLKFKNIGSKGVEGEVGKGEMVLVAGGSEGSAILSEISGARRHQGEVETKKGLRVYWVSNEDEHLANLTVCETLSFIKRCYGCDSAIEWAMKTTGLNIACKNTRVASLSTGEKRRLSIAEALLSEPDLIIADQCTKGLDSETAVALLKNIRRFCRDSSASFIGTQLHTSVVGFSAYDTVLLLSTTNDQLYFGPSSSMQGHLQSLGYTPSPPSRPFFPHGLTGIEVDALHATWVDREKSTRRLTRSNNSHLPRVQPERSYSSQLATLWKREVALQYSKTLVSVRLGRFVIQSVLFGALFSELDRDQIGGYNRMALLFSLVVSVNMGVFTVIPDVFTHLPVFVKHRLNRAYSPPLWVTAIMLTELPLVLAECVVLTGPLYGLAKLDFGKYPVLLGILWLLSLCSASLVRLVSFLSGKLTVAQTACITLLVSQLFFCGYFIPRANIPDGWAAAFYLSPYNYAYESLAISQFYGEDFYCTMQQTLPPWNVTDGCSDLLSDFCRAYQGNTSTCLNCALPHWESTFRTACTTESLLRWCGGDSSGYCPPMWQSGSGFVDYYWSISSPSSKTWVNSLWLILMTVVLTCALAVFTLFKKVTMAEYSYEKDHALKETRSTRLNILNDATACFTQVNATDAAASLLDTETTQPALIAWRDITYTVGTREVLKNVEGWCEPGAMVALIGTSGSGKTTLLNAIARRNKASGVVKVNGISVGRKWRYGYVLREDVHDNRESTLEALTFAAKLKYSCESYLEIVTRVATLLGIEKYLKKPLCDLPPEAVRLVTIGVELVSGQSALFLDEPTAGLDPNASLTLLRALRRVACYGCSVVCSIHQPSKELFSLFDRFIVLSSTGGTLFQGTSKQAWEYLQDCVTAVTTSTATPENIADNFLSVVAQSRPYEGHFKVFENGRWGCCGVEDAEARCSAGNEDAWEACWKNSREAGKIERIVTEMLQAINGGPADEGTGSKPSMQVRELIKRKWKVYLRFPTYVVCRIGFATVVALLVGTTFWDLGHTQRDLHCYVTVVAGSIVVGIIPALSSVIPIFDERSVMYRETLSSMYSARLYGFVNVVSEVPMLVFSSGLWCSIVFWMCNLPTEAFGVFAVGFTFFSLFQSCFGQVAAALSPSLYVAEVVLPVVTMLWMVFAGFMVPIASFPAVLKLFYYVNPYTFFLRSMVSNLLHFRTEFYCDSSEIIFVPPEFCPNLLPNTTEGQGTTPTLPECEVCPYTSSTTLLNWYSWSYSTLVPDVLGLAVSSVLIGCLYVFFASRVKWS